MTATITDPTPAPVLAPTIALSTGDLESELLGLAGNLAAAQCRFLQLLAEFDRRGGWVGPGLKSCAHWLCWRIGMSLRTAAEHVRVAHALARLPKITEAFAAGRISYSKVRAITRLVGQPTPDPPADSPGAPAPVRAAGPDPADSDPAGGAPTGGDPAGDPERRADSSRPGPVGTGPHPETDPHRADPHQETEPVAGCTPSADHIPDGGHDLDGSHGTEVPRLAGDAEQVLLDLALAGTASHVETVVRAARRAQTDPNRVTALRSLSWHHADDGSLILRGRFTPDEGAHLVAAIEALVTPRRPVTHPVPAPPEGWQDLGREQAPGAVDDRIAARRADALIALVAANTAGEDGSTVARGKAHVIVHVEAATGAARIEGGPEIPASTAERIACDADVQVLLQDTNSNRLYLSRRRRLATPAQIAALTVRDGAGCRFPGCSHTRHLRGHHIRHWLHRGPTDLDNLVLVCGFHHRLIHDTAYGIRWDDGKWLSRPDGAPVPEAGAPLDGNTESLIELNTRAQLRITRDSLTPYWTGERLDPDPILQHLLPRQRQAAA